MLLQKLLLFYLRHFPYDGGKYALTKYVKLPATTSIVYKNSLGIEFALNIEEYQMKQIFLFDLYERNTIRHLRKLINEMFNHPLTFMDVGANIGFYSMTFAKAYKKSTSTIHSFEPNPSTFALLKQNVERNKITNIYLNQLGLSSTGSSAVLTSSLHNLGAANIFSANKSGDQSIIELQTLDNYCENLRISNIDVIKVDIEGAELAFMQGADNIIRQSEKLIMIMEIVDENCERAGYKAETLFDYCINSGFKAYLPKAWPFGLKKIKKIPVNYHDNIFFLKGLS